MESLHNYSHVLSKDLVDRGYGLHVEHQPQIGGDSLHAVATQHGKQIGRLEGAFVTGRLPGVGVHTGMTRVDKVKLDDSHGLGLRQAMHQAFFDHAVKNLGATHDVTEGPVSSLDHAARKKIAGGHGVEIHSTQTSGIGGTAHKMTAPTQLGKSDLYDDGATDEIHRMMAIPEERALALKMRGVCEDHLCAGLQYPELIGKIIGHKAFGDQTTHAVLSNPNLREHWGSLMDKGLSSDHLHTLRGSCMGTEAEAEMLDRIVADPKCATHTAKELLDLGHLGALGHQATEKWVLDMYVHWHVSHPENIWVGEIARQALKDPRTSEHCYGLALTHPDPATKLAALEAKYYLPVDEAKTILQMDGDVNTPLRLAVVSHPLCPKELLQIGATDRDAVVRAVAKPRLLGIMVKDGSSPRDIALTANPEGDRAGQPLQQERISLQP